MFVRKSSQFAFALRNLARRRRGADSQWGSLSAVRAFVGADDTVLCWLAGTPMDLDSPGNTVEGSSSGSGPKRHALDTTGAGLSTEALTTTYKDQFSEELLTCDYIIAIVLYLITQMPFSAYGTDAAIPRIITWLTETLPDEGMESPVDPRLVREDYIKTKVSHRWNPSCTLPELSPREKEWFKELLRIVPPKLEGPPAATRGDRRDDITCYIMLCAMLAMGIAFDRMTGPMFASIYFAIITHFHGDHLEGFRAKYLATLLTKLSNSGKRIMYTSDMMVKLLNFGPHAHRAVVRDLLRWPDLDPSWLAGLKLNELKETCEPGLFVLPFDDGHCFGGISTFVLDARRLPTGAKTRLWFITGDCYADEEYIFTMKDRFKQACDKFGELEPVHAVVDGTRARPGRGDRATAEKFMFDRVKRAMEGRDPAEVFVGMNSVRLSYVWRPALKIAEHYGWGIYVGEAYPLLRSYEVLETDEIKRLLLRLTTDPKKANIHILPRPTMQSFWACQQTAETLAQQKYATPDGIKLALAFQTSAWVRLDDEITVQGVGCVAHVIPTGYSDHTDYENLHNLLIRLVKDLGFSSDSIHILQKGYHNEIMSEHRRRLSLVA